MRYADLLESRPRTLYHGTLTEFVPDILKHGLKPQVGSLTTKWYAAKDVPMRPYVFAADARGLEKCVNVIAKQLRIKYGEDHDLGGVFQKEAALLVIREGTQRHGFQMTPWESDEFMKNSYGLPPDQYDMAFKRAPKTSEPGDYWTRKKVRVDVHKPLPCEHSASALDLALDVGGYRPLHNGEHRSPESGRRTVAGNGAAGEAGDHPHCRQA